MPGPEAPPRPGPGTDPAGSPRALPRGLYIIVDAAFGDPVALGREALDLGGRCLQLRAKGWSAEAVARATAALLPLAEAAGAVLIVNDHLDVAREEGAHGVHLGQEDLAGQDLAAVRLRLGPGRLLGASTHSPEQVLAAQEADYLGYGPVFPTGTKDTGYAARGLEGLAEACRLSRRPVVAIGGITPARRGRVEAAGAHAWAVISALWTAPDRAAALAALQPGLPSPETQVWKQHSG